MNDIYKALADPTRRDILAALRGGEQSAGQLAALFPLNKSTLSGHFAVLRAADLVISEKRGTTVIYRLNTTVFQDMLSSLLDLFGAPEPNAKAEEA